MQEAGCRSLVDFPPGSCRLDAIRIREHDEREIYEVSERDDINENVSARCSDGRLILFDFSSCAWPFKRGAPCRKTVFLLC